MRQPESVYEMTRVQWPTVKMKRGHKIPDFMVKLHDTLRMLRLQLMEPQRHHTQRGTLVVLVMQLLVTIMPKMNMPKTTKTAP